MSEAVQQECHMLTTNGHRRAFQTIIDIHKEVFFYGFIALDNIEAASRCSMEGMYDIC
jgi:hypothetical protein